VTGKHLSFAVYSLPPAVVKPVSRKRLARQDVAKYGSTRTERAVLRHHFCFRQVANCLSSGSGTGHVEGYHIIHPRVASGILVLFVTKVKNSFSVYLPFETPIQSLQTSVNSYSNNIINNCSHVNQKPVGNVSMVSTLLDT
jgi:hypothetical protein